ncbi:MAG: class I SAM-dependent methyltransferase [Leptolyngbyaceae cyanobacterium MO_188.B28]|nr:class I SAM-dependent methyltransferase [Leptolyngbyaceae cyanobacterium MO_188.B28]
MSQSSNKPTKHSLLERDWSVYYRATKGRPPRETLLFALTQFEAEAPSKTRRFAVDLGCGDGRDTVELLRQGWRVLAIDGEKDAIALLRQRSGVNRTFLETRVQRFESLTLPPSVDLVNASFCLQFCPPEYFLNLWREIVTSLRSGGRFCGQLFGDRDSWTTAHSNIYGYTREHVEALLQSFELEYFEEEEHPGKTPLGEGKHWHLFHIVARKL